MKLYFFSLLAFFFLLLSDPEGGGSCGGCYSSISEVGVLPDTTLTVGSIWDVIIREQLWQINESCDYDYYDNYSTYAPYVSAYTSNSNVEITQQNGVLHFNAIAQGTSVITLVAGVRGDIDPELLSQTIRITVN